MAAHISSRATRRRRSGHRGQSTPKSWVSRNRASTNAPARPSTTPAPDELEAVDAAPGPAAWPASRRAPVARRAPASARRPSTRRRHRDRRATAAAPATRTSTARNIVKRCRATASDTTVRIVRIAAGRLIRVELVHGRARDRRVARRVVLRPQHDDHLRSRFDVVVHVDLRPQRAVERRVPRVADDAGDREPRRRPDRSSSSLIRRPIGFSPGSTVSAIIALMSRTGGLRRRRVRAAAALPPRAESPIVRK